MKQGAFVLTGSFLLAAVGIVIAWMFWRKLNPQPRPDEAPSSNTFSRLTDGVVSSVSGVEGDSLGTWLNRQVESFTGFFKESVSSLTTGKPSYWDNAQAEKTKAALQANFKPSLPPTTTTVIGQLNKGEINLDRVASMNKNVPIDAWTPKAYLDSLNVIP